VAMYKTAKPIALAYFRPPFAILLKHSLTTGGCIS
jgi:hypothetical protein